MRIREAIMTKWVKIFLSLLAFVILFPIPLYANGFGGGNGSKESPYLIHNEEELRKLQIMVNDDGNTFYECFIKLENNLDLKGILWQPIGCEATPFQGIFDGNGHTISGLSNVEETEYMGLFGYVEGGTIYNLGIKDCKIRDESNERFIGGIVGCLENGTILSCFTTGQISGINITAGGLAGKLMDGQILACFSNTYIQADHGVVGGLVGTMTGFEDQIQNSYNLGTIVGEKAGGIAGSVLCASIDHCISLGEIVEGESVGPFTYDGEGVGQNNWVLKSLADQLEIEVNVLEKEQLYHKDVWATILTDTYWRFEEGCLPQLAIFRENIAWPEHLLIKKTEKPLVNMMGGRYRSMLFIELMSPTENAIIYYTLDGSVPTENSMRYEKEILVDCNVTLKAMAIRAGWEASEVLTETYTFQTDEPQANPTSGVYDSVQQVSLSTTTEGALIYYTLDGSMPNENSIRYEKEIRVDCNMILKAMAIRAGWEASEVLTETYTFQTKKRTDKPQANPTGGVYDSVQQVSLSTTTEGALIYYTLDGSMPTVNSILYEKEIRVDCNVTLKAMAIRAGWEDSDILTETYTFQTKKRTDKPQANPTGGVYDSVQQVSLRTTTEGALIYYTLDGSMPTVNSIRYEKEIRIDCNMTLKAMAIRAGWEDSEILTETYTLQTEKPQANPTSGVYDSVQLVSLSTTTEGALIYYTLDGSMPTVNSILYEKEIRVDCNVTLKAMAIRAGWEDSDILTETYTFQTKKRTDKPQANPTGGVYDLAQLLSLSTTTEGALIYYTLDGSIPAVNSMRYEKEIRVDRSMTLKAMAIRAGWEASEVLTETYTLQAEKPQANPMGGKYDSVQQVSLSTTTEGALIYYTLDGSVPNANANLYAKPIAISSNTTLKALAVREGWALSPILTETYQFEKEQNPTPSGSSKTECEELSVPYGIWCNSQFIKVDLVGEKQVVLPFSFDQFGTGKLQIPGLFLSECNKRRIEIKVVFANQMGEYIIPSNFIKQISGLHDILKKEGLKPDEISLHLTISENRKIENLQTNNKIYGQDVITSVSYDLKLYEEIGGRFISDLNTFNQPIIRRICLPGDTAEQADRLGVLRLSNTGKSLEFVPHKSIWRDDRLWFELYSSQNSEYIVMKRVLAFPDVSVGHWASAEILKAATKGLIEGDKMGRFSPDRAVTRGEFIHMLMNGLDIHDSPYKTKFKDVDEKAWYANAVNQADALGWLDYFSGNELQPEQAITRLEMACIVSNVLGDKNKTDRSELPFKDIERLSEMEKEKISQLVACGIVQGTSSIHFEPTSTMTRAQAVVVQMRMLRYLKYLD